MQQHHQEYLFNFILRDLKSYLLQQELSAISFPFNFIPETILPHNTKLNQLICVGIFHCKGATLILFVFIITSPPKFQPYMTRLSSEVHVQPWKQI